ncbi:DUF1559 family PulG-like putative transporter [Paludisphaera mucosa]|uniref:DUF1559 domain-containing protein n=1 Tax=Paludisphaera mucosa TaxID=3030827 RepID=A0ABT6FH96_9BACT|nr:DUF1559 domain-containing protein [Paludisphaera mucosa]MDG3006920.1 DUF1559 domain-containing protein [Paludisphaera mucosa]
MTPRRPHRGITLLEVVAVIFILLVLVALILPALGPASDLSRRARCINNLKQMALATLNYESAHGVFPPAFGPSPTIEVLNYPRASVQVAILPFLGGIEEVRLYDGFNFRFGLQGVADHPNQDPNLTAASTQVSTFICPSDPAEAKLQGRIGFDNYFASIGATACAELGPAPPHYPANMVETDVRLAGIFNVTLDHAAPAVLPDGSYNPDYRKVAGWSTIASATDGTAATSLFSETLRSASVHGEAESIAADSLRNVYGVSTASFTTPAPPSPATCREGRRIAYRGQQYYRASAATSFYSHTMTPNAPVSDCANVDSDFVAGHTAARSAHPGGVDVGLADGSVRFIKNTIDPAVWRALGTKAGGEKIPADY